VFFFSFFSENLFFSFSFTVRVLSLFSFSFFKNHARRFLSFSAALPQFVFVIIINHQWTSTTGRFVLDATSLLTEPQMNCSSFLFSCESSTSAAASSSSAVLMIASPTLSPALEPVSSWTTSTASALMGSARSAIREANSRVMKALAAFSRASLASSGQLSGGA